MRISSTDHGRLKRNYERIFKENWPSLSSSLAGSRFALSDWKIVNYEGTMTRPGAGNRDPEGPQRGGLKVELYGDRRDPVAFLWMRGSGTEPVFRVLVDVEGERPEIEEKLLAAHKEMIRKADGAE
jgi:phosphoglucomutase